jgi:hypothetical protein
MAGMSIKSIQRRRRPEWIKKFVLAVVSACLVFLSGELLVRYMIPPWPFESPVYFPSYLSARNATLRWRFSSGEGRSIKITEALMRPMSCTPNGRIREIREDHGISMLDLIDSIYKGGGVTLFQDHLCLNGKGNDVVANELEKYIVNLLELRS